MAGYSDNRESNFEAKYLRKVLLTVDDNIHVPDSVRGDSLRRKLDSIEPPEPATPDTKSGMVFGLRWFSWQSGVTYAAAFALIVGLFYGLGYHQQPRIVDGNVELAQMAPENTMEFSPADSDIQIVVEDDVAGETQTDGGDASLVQPYSSMDDAPAAAPPAPRVGGGGRSNATLGVGGVESEQLGAQDGYSYAVRANDASDPDKAGFAYTVDIISEEDGQLAAQIDISDISVVEDAHFGDGTFSLVGSSDGGVVTRTYNVADPAQPQEVAVQQQPGTYVSSRIYQNVVHTVSYSDDAAGIASVEALPYAVSDSVCVITAVDTVEAQTNQVAFAGADDSISLFDLSAYITYEGETTEIPEEEPSSDQPPEEVDEALLDIADDVVSNDKSAETQKHYAQILLNGTDITLATVS